MLVIEIGIAALHLAVKLNSLIMSMSKPFNSQIMHFLDDGGFFCHLISRQLERHYILVKYYLKQTQWTASLKNSRIQVYNATPVKLKKKY